MDSKKTLDGLDPPYLYAGVRPLDETGRRSAANPNQSAMPADADLPADFKPSGDVRSREEIIEHLRKNPRMIETIRSMIRAGKFPGLAPMSEQEIPGMAEEILKGMSATTAFDPAAAGSCSSAMAGVHALERLQQIEAAKARGEEVVVLGGERILSVPPVHQMLAIAGAMTAGIGRPPGETMSRRRARRQGASGCGVGNRHIAGYQPAPEGGIKAKKTAGRNDPCPCGCGKKAKKCEQRKTT